MVETEIEIVKYWWLQTEGVGSWYLVILERINKEDGWDMFVVSNIYKVTHREWIIKNEILTQEENTFSQFYCNKILQHKRKT